MPTSSVTGKGNRKLNEIPLYSPQPESLGTDWLAWAESEEGGKGVMSACAMLCSVLMEDTCAVTAVQRLGTSPPNRVQSLTGRYIRVTVSTTSPRTKQVRRLKSRVNTHIVGDLKNTQDGSLTVLKCRRGP